MNLATTIEMHCYGTSEGVEKAWDTRGRGRKTDLHEESKGRHGNVSPDFYEQGMSRKEEDGSSTLRVMRGGSEFGSKETRGGTWYEVKKFPWQRSSYDMQNALAKVPTGVGGKGTFEKELNTKKPLMVDVTGKGEGREPLVAYNKLFGEDASKRGLSGYHAEKNYAKIESKVAGKAKELGFDSIVFYDHTAGKNYPRTVFDFMGSAKKVE